MPMFKVRVTRETVDELEFLVEAPGLESFQDVMDDELYEAGDSVMGDLKHWHIIENDIDVNIQAVETHKKPKLVFDDTASPGEAKFKVYVPPSIDDRQMPLPGTEDDDECQTS